MKFLDYPERQKHGDQDLPWYFYHVTYIHPRYSMPYHWHPLFEIVHVFQGHFRLQLEDRELLLAPGDSAFISSGDTHGGEPLERDSCCYECLLLDLDAIFAARLFDSRIAGILNQELLVKKYFPASFAQINATVRSMLELTRCRPDGYTLLLQGYILLLFGQILQNGCYVRAEAAAYPRKPVPLKNVIAYIDEHYPEKIRLSDLAECANMNENYFCRYFRSLTHRTPMDYLNYYRIEVACEQLLYTDKTVTEIAYDCGFQDASYFVKVFKRYRNQTPSEYVNARFR